MKLPRRRRKPAPETAEPASASRAAPVLQVLIFSNTDLPEQEFNDQREKIRRVAYYDSTAHAGQQSPPLSMLPKIASALGVDPLRLITNAVRDGGSAESGSLAATVHDKDLRRWAGQVIRDTKSLPHRPARHSGLRHQMMLAEGSR
jgi:hypothetical protein